MVVTKVRDTESKKLRLTPARIDSQCQRTGSVKVPPFDQCVEEGLNLFVGQNSFLSYWLVDWAFDFVDDISEFWILRIKDCLDEISERTERCL